MAAINPILWIIGTILLYVAVRFLAIAVWESFRYRDGITFATGALAVVPGLVSLPIVQTASVRYATATALAAIGLFAASEFWKRRTKDWRRTKERNAVGRSVTLHLVLLTGAAVFMIPFAWLVTTSFKEEDQMMQFPPVWIPTRQVSVDLDGTKYKLSTMALDGQTVKVAEMLDLEDGTKKVRVLSRDPSADREIFVDRTKLTKVRKFGLKWENYSGAIDYMPKEALHGLLYLWNTIYITLLSILGTLLSGSLVAYGFARLKWIGRDVLFAVLLATMMIPQAVTMVPLYIIFRNLGWIDTLRPMWVPAFLGGGAFSVFLLRQFFMTIPLELEDAAKIDGCGFFTIYWRIMLPLIKPALAALTIMTFLSRWNDLMGPLIYCNSPEKMTLAYGLQMFLGEHGSEFGLLMSASTMMLLPVLLIFFFTQRYFIEGITLTGIKG